MSKKIPIGISIAVLLVAVAASCFVSINVVVRHYNELLVDLPQRAEQYSNLADIEELVRREYFGNIDSEAIDESLATGFLNGLEDSFCYYISSEDFEDYSNLIKGRMPGVGINAYYEKTTDNLVVSSVDESSPVYETEIKKDTQIVSVNGKDITEKNYKLLLSELCDAYDGKVKLSYLQVVDDKKTETKEIELSCGYFDISCFSSIESNVGYVRISNFYENTVQEFQNIMNTFSDEGLDSVVIDLRNTSGADLDVAADMIDIIVPVGNEGTGAIFTAKNSSGDIIKQASSDANSMSSNFAVLVNDRTECAAELMACDLRDFGKAVLVGEKTSGHGSLQELFRLEDGAAVTLTVAEIIPYTSESFNGKGLEPDLNVAISESMKNQLINIALSDDPQFQAALEYLKTK